MYPQMKAFRKHKSRRRLIVSLSLVSSGILLACVALFLPWFRGRLAVVGKTVNALAFPEVTAIVLSGGVLSLGFFIFFIIKKKDQLARFIAFAILTATIIGALVTLRSYANQGSFPGVGVQTKIGVILTFVGLITALAGALAVDHRTPSGDDGE